jgi:hypothetical protein
MCLGGGLARQPPIAPRHHLTYAPAASPPFPVAPATGLPSTTTDREHCSVENKFELDSGVVARAIDVEGCKTNYYGIINKILEFSFTGNKELKVAFFDCDWFDRNNRTR